MNPAWIRHLCDSIQNLAKHLFNFSEWCFGLVVWISGRWKCWKMHSCWIHAEFMLDSCISEYWLKMFFLGVDFQTAIPKPPQKIYLGKIQIISRLQGGVEFMLNSCWDSCWIHADFMLNSVRDNQRFTEPLVLKSMPDSCWIHAEFMHFQHCKFKESLVSDSCQIHAEFTLNSAMQIQRIISVRFMLDSCTINYFYFFYDFGPISSSPI